MRVAQPFAGGEHRVGAPLRDDRIRQAGIVDHADGGDQDAGLPAHLLRQRHLVSRAGLDALVRHEPAAGDVDEVGARRSDARGRADGVVDVPAAVRGVRAREPHEHRRVGRGLTHRRGHALEQAHASVERPAVLVVSVVAQRREELVQQVAVGGMDLEHLEAGRDRAAGGIREIGHDLLDARCVELSGLGEAGVGDRRRGDGRPAAVLDGHGSPAPGQRRRGRRLASRVTELHARDRTARADRGDDRRPGLDLRVVPQPDIVGGYATLR